MPLLLIALRRRSAGLVPYFRHRGNHSHLTTTATVRQLHNAAVTSPPTYTTGRMSRLPGKDSSQQPSIVSLLLTNGRSSASTDPARKVPASSRSSFVVSTPPTSSAPPQPAPQNALRPIKPATSIMVPPEFIQPRADTFAAATVNVRSSVSELPKPPADTKSTPGPVYFDENDFSDDINLELEIKATATLGPDSQVPRPAPAQAAGSSFTTVAIPWSSSPPSHLEPKQPVRSLKRDSTLVDDEASPAPEPKKRAIPDRWMRSQSDIVPARSLAANHAPWNQSFSEVKQQQRQLRGKVQRIHSSAAAMAAPNKSRAPPPKVATVVDPMLVSLSTEQQHVLKLVVEMNQSVFFTGPAGTGKSVLLRHIISALRQKHKNDPERVGVTASTGLAACNIGGMTLHSFSGIGMGREDAATLVRKVRMNPKAKSRWQQVRTLIIDEISMVDGDLFDKLSQIGRTLRNDGRPWGGIQLVITGDFFQLPPVPDGFDNKRDVKFAFEADTWTTSIAHTIGLTQVFRQKDPEFAGMLNEMRLGKLSDSTIQTFQSLARPLVTGDTIEVTELFSTRVEVDGSNRRKLQALGGESVMYDARDDGRVEASLRDKLLSNMMAPKNIELKVGAQVMLIKNIDESLVNGTIGKVIAFKTEAEFNLEALRNESPDSPTPEGSPELMGIKAKKRMEAFKNELQSGAPSTRKESTKKFPIVKFRMPNGTFREVYVLPETWRSDLPTGEVQASRTQLPLILAWALSIHKAQGQSLPFVKVDLRRVFEKGQAYVALSRAMSKQGLQVLGFQRQKVMAHSKVIQFYNQLYTAQDATSGVIKTRDSVIPELAAVKTGSTARPNQQTNNQSKEKRLGQRDLSKRKTLGQNNIMKPGTPQLPSTEYPNDTVSRALYY